MAELKRTFSAGKMNKDLDERIVPPGEYRDAQNIEINTSEGSNIGAVQTTLGNTAIDSGKVPFNSHCMGVVTDPANDMVYWLVRGPNQFSPFGSAGPNSEFINKNYLLRKYIGDLPSIAGAIGTFQYVFVDIYNVRIKCAANVTNSKTFVVNATVITDGTKCLRPGMRVINQTTFAFSQIDEVYVVSVDDNTNTVTLNKEVSINQDDLIEFEAPSVLLGDPLSKEPNYTVQGNFATGTFPVNLSIIGSVNRKTRIPGGFLFISDDRIEEPRKLNIERCVAGTGGTNRMPGFVQGTFNGDAATFHTRLYTDPSQDHNLEIVSNGGGYGLGDNYIGVEKEHATVIKKAPTLPPKLKMSNTFIDDGRVNSITNVANSIVTTLTTNFFDSSNNQFFQVGDTIDDLIFDSTVDFRVGDIVYVALTADLFNPNSFGTSEASISLLIIDVPSGHTPPNTLDVGASGDGFDVEILSIDENILDTTDQEFSIILKEPEPIFKDKFPRFCYRYKYTDGEYSNFGPWSELAFIPNEFDYIPKKGHNLGMINDLKSLEIQEYFRPDDERPRDVVAIDILYKETNNPTVYVAKTISRRDGVAGPFNALWPDTSANPQGRGSLPITTETVHKILPSNQLLRPYDNVPRYPRSQEIVSNRVVYGNYYENYELIDNSSQPINIDLAVSLSQKPSSDAFTPHTSCKSIREYQVGIVYGDKYGRETPVLTNEKATIFIPQDDGCIKRNKLKVANQHNAPFWASYYKYYIKETSREYYNLALDRWYNAEDGNIWLSFPASDRNKVDEETYLIIKNKHESNQAVTDANRYKILAIEGSAPDFIKINKKDLGTLNCITADQTILPSGFPLPGVKEIHIDAGKMYKAFGGTGRTTDDPGRTDLKDFEELYIRFFSSFDSSRYYRISKISKDTSDLNNVDSYFYKILLEDEDILDADVTWTSANNSYASAVPSLKIQIKAHEPENRPEFDGRFFAKIEKDLNADQYIAVDPGSLDDEDGGPQFRVIASQQVRLISHKWPLKQGTLNWYTGTTGQGPHTYDTHGASFGEFVGWTSYPRYMHYTVKSGELEDSKGGGGENNWGNGHLAKTFWQGESMIDGQGLDFFFIDEVGAAKGCAGLGMFDCRGYSTSQGYVFPQLPFESTNPVYPNGVSNDSFSTGGDNYWHGYSHRNGDEFDDSTPPNGSSVCHTVKGTGAEPATYTHINSMHLSYSKVSSEGDEDMYGPSNGDKASFVEQLSTPGSLFRFQEEPEPRQIYKIAYSEDDGAGSISDDPSKFYTGIRNYQDNNTDGDKDSPSNKRHRFGITVTHPNNDVPLDPLQVSDLGAFGFGSEQGWNPISNTFIANTDPATQAATPYLSMGTGVASANGINMGKQTPDDWVDSLNLGGTGSGDEDKWRTFQPDTYTATMPDGTANPSTGLDWLGRNAVTIEFIEDINVADGGFDDFKKQSKYPAIFETEPKENVDIDLYYEASQAIPIHINEYNNEQFIPLGSTFFINGANTTSGTGFTAKVVEWTGPNEFKYEEVNGGNIDTIAIAAGVSESFTLFNNHVIRVRLDASPITNNTATQGFIKIQGSNFNPNPNHRPHNQLHNLGWFNCYMFGNGVESDRIRDDFNETQLDNGVKVSSVVAGRYTEEHKSNFLIYSGIYNSISGVNETNQFIQGEKITKQLSPRFGTIQKLFTRDTDLNVFCEDKVIKVLADKDALFNADGNTNVTATSNVLGQAVPYPSDFGISKNPESFAADNRVMYFADKSRGAIVQLSDRGMMAISDIGMKDFFADELNSVPTFCPIIGTFDTKKDLYNISMLKRGFNYSDEDGVVQDWPQAGGLNKGPSFNTVSFNSKQKGWVSFATFFPETGISLNNRYFTFNQGTLFEHHTNSVVNDFYEITSTVYQRGTSHITPIFNDNHSAVKEYGYINYEGTQAKVSSFTTGTSTLDSIGGGTTTYTYADGDGEFFNLNDSNGWKVESITTDLQSGFVPEFVQKEGKWFGYVRGSETEVTAKNFNVQGLGLPSNISFDLAGGVNNFNINLSV